MKSVTVKLSTSWSRHSWLRLRINIPLYTSSIHCDKKAIINNVDHEFAGFHCPSTSWNRKLWFQWPPCLLAMTMCYHAFVVVIWHMQVSSGLWPAYTGIRYWPHFKQCEQSKKTTKWIWTITVNWALRFAVGTKPKSVVGVSCTAPRYPRMYRIVLERRDAHP